MSENPYAPPAAPLADAARVEEEVEYAGFWERFVATIIDTLLILVITLPLLLAVYGTAYFDSEKFVQGPADLLISYVLPAVAVLWFWIARQATPGKMALSLKIVDARTGGAPSAGHLVWRYLAYFVAMLPFFLGFIWVAFDARKQGWHDKMARTVVIKARRK